MEKFYSCRRVVVHEIKTLKESALGAKMPELVQDQGLPATSVECLCNYIVDKRTKQACANENITRSKFS